MQLRRSAGGAGRREVARAAGLVAAVLAALLVAADARATQAHESAQAGDASRLVYLLEYVGTDYAGAVQGGAVVNQAEYGEVLRLVSELRDGYGARRGRDQKVAAGLAELEKQVRTRAPADQVAAATRALRPALARSVGDAPLPPAAPNLAAGRRLYESDCAPCHGDEGAGDGPSSADMTPPPTAFRGRLMEQLTPRHVYDALTLGGVAGTAMPSFAGAYGEQQRWDVAFYLMTLRVGFAPSPPPRTPPVTLEELASSTDDELLARLRRGRPGATMGEVDHLRLEGAPRTLAAAGKGTADGAAQGAPQGGLTAALQIQDAFARAAERVAPRVVGVTGYVRDPSWSEERLGAARGPAWAAAHLAALRYPGFRPVRWGSGFIVDDDGYVLSRDQLLRDDQGGLVALVDVELPDQVHRVASVVGSEPSLDLAVLHLDGEPPEGLPKVELGDSDRLEPGHWLIALGDPPGSEKDIAVGVVASAPGRQCYQQEMSATRVQSSLAIVDRARGGPVIDVLGRVVGLSVGEPHGAQGQTHTPGPGGAYVMPINLVLNLFEALKAAQSTRSPWLGISVLELQRFAARRGGGEPPAALPPSGIAIDDVFSPSPAASAGVRPGDFLVELGGHRIASVGDFQKWLYVLGIGAKVELGLLRDGAPLRVEATIEARPPSATTS